MKKRKYRFGIIVGLGLAIVAGKGCEGEPPLHQGDKYLNATMFPVGERMKQAEQHPRSDVWCSSSLCVNRFKASTL